MSDIPTSGAISLNQMHTEVGGTSGTQVSLNDADIRGLISKASGATMSFNEWYGASAALDVQTVTVGVAPAAGYLPAIYGYSSPSSLGSISDGTFDVKSGATIYMLRHFGNGIFQLQIAGSHSNSGWTTVNVAGTNYSRSSATFTQASSATLWAWTESTNPFGTTANATKVVTFT